VVGNSQVVGGRDSKSAKCDQGYTIPHRDWQMNGRTNDRYRGLAIAKSCSTLARGCCVPTPTQRAIPTGWVG